MSSNRPKNTVTCNSACVFRALLGLEDMNMGDTEKENVYLYTALWFCLFVLYRSGMCLGAPGSPFVPQRSGKLTSPPSGGNR